jgi:hypothetical protein
VVGDNLQLGFQKLDSLPTKSKFPLELQTYREYYFQMPYSSGQAARKLGIGVSTLSKYLTANKIPAPRSVTTGGITVYLWGEKDIKHARKLLPKIANGRKTRYQKKQSRKAKLKTKKQPQPRTAHGAPGSSTVPHKQSHEKK